MKKEKIEYEKCVVCGELTTTPVQLAIDRRTNFVIGVGELCSKCMLEVYCDIDPFVDKDRIGGI